MWNHHEATYIACQNLETSYKRFTLLQVRHQFKDLSTSKTIKMELCNSCSQPHLVE